MSILSINLFFYIDGYIYIIHIHIFWRTNTNVNTGLKYSYMPSQVIKARNIFFLLFFPPPEMGWDMVLIMVGEIGTFVVGC